MYERDNSRQDLLLRVQQDYKNYNLSLLGYLILLLANFYLIFFIYMTEMAYLLDTNFFRVFVLVRLFSFILVLIHVYRLAKTLKLNNKDKTSPFLWVIIIFLPLVNIIAVFLLYRKIRRFIKELKSS